MKLLILGAAALMFRSMDAGDNGGGATPDPGTDTAGDIIPGQKQTEETTTTETSKTTTEQSDQPQIGRGHVIPEGGGDVAKDPATLDSKKSGG